MGSHVGVGSAEWSDRFTGTAPHPHVRIASEGRLERHGTLDQTVVTRSPTLLHPAAVAVSDSRCLERVAAGPGDA